MLAAQSYYRLTGFLLLTVMSRKLPEQSIGVFFFAVAFAESVLVFANFSLNSVMSRRVAANPENAGEQFGPLAAFRLISSPLWLIAVIGAAALFTSADWRVMAVAAVVVLLEDIYFSFGSLFLALRKATYNVAIGITVQTIFLATFMLSMQTRPSIGALLGSHLLRSAALASVAMVVTQRSLFRVQGRWNSGYVHAGIPFILLALLHVGREQLGTLMLGFIAGYDAVAQYNLAYRVVVASLFIPTAICSVLVPLLVADKLNARNRRLLLRSAVAVVIAGLGLSAFVFMFALPFGRLLYGPIAPQVVPVLRWLAVSFPITFAALFLSLVLQALYQEKRVVLVLLAVTVANGVMNFLFIPEFGARGAVLAQIVASLVQLILLGWLMIRILRFPAEIKGTPSYEVMWMSAYSTRSDSTDDG